MIQLHIFQAKQISINYCEGRNAINSQTYNITNTNLQIKNTSKTNQLLHTTNHISKQRNNNTSGYKTMTK